MKYFSLTFACFLVVNWLGRIPVVPFSAVVTVAAGGEMPAFEADSSGHAARQFPQLHVELALPRMAVAVAR